MIEMSERGFDRFPGQGEEEQVVSVAKIMQSGERVELAVERS